MLVWMNTKRNGSLDLLNFRYMYFELGVENWLYVKVFRMHVDFFGSEGRRKLPMYTCITTALYVSLFVMCYLCGLVLLNDT